jgi:GTPase SAR1 family protein
MLWDTAGEEKYHSIIPSFIRGAQCVIILYDVTKSNTFANCEKWLNMLKSMKSDTG